jgi:predicted aspartyl protease
MEIDGYVLQTIRGGKPIVGLEFNNGVTATALLDTGCNLELVIDDALSVSQLGLAGTETGLLETVETANGPASYRIGIVTLKLLSGPREVSIHIRQPVTAGPIIVPSAGIGKRRPSASDELTGHIPLLFGTQLLEGCHLTVVFAHIASERRVTIRPA